MLWDDVGPISQGKILTAILQEREAEARDALARWTLGDLLTLRRALGLMSGLTDRAMAEKRSARRGG